MITYRTTIEQFGEDTGIPVPDEVLARLGAGPHPRVDAEVEGHQLTGTIGVVAGRPLLELDGAQRAAARLQRGQQVTVELELAASAEPAAAPAAPDATGASSATSDAPQPAPAGPAVDGARATSAGRDAAEEPDDGAEPVEVPDDLAAALASSPLAGARFDDLPRRDRERLAARITSVDAADARERQVASVIATLESGGGR